MLKSHISSLHKLRHVQVADGEDQSNPLSPSAENVPGGSLSKFWSNKPFVNYFSRHSRARGRMYEENRTAAEQQAYENERELDKHQSKAVLAARKTAVDAAALRAEAMAQLENAEAIAASGKAAVGRAMQQSTNIAVYASGLIRSVDENDEIDKQVGEYHKNTIRRLAKHTMANLECAALGIDFDPSMDGGV